jgi:hypothetical protein
MLIFIRTHTSDIGAGAASSQGGRGQGKTNLGSKVLGKPVSGQVLAASLLDLPKNVRGSKVLVWGGGLRLGSIARASGDLSLPPHIVHSLFGSSSLAIALWLACSLVLSLSLFLSFSLRGSHPGMQWMRPLVHFASYLLAREERLDRRTIVADIPCCLSLRERKRVCVERVRMCI